jgi:hypothetical protein
MVFNITVVIFLTYFVVGNLLQFTNLIKSVKVDCNWKSFAVSGPLGTVYYKYL